MQMILVVSSILLWVVVGLNLLLTLALVRRQGAGPSVPSSPGDGLPKGAQAPAFSARKLSGEPVTQANYQGRSVAFLFVGPGCGPCRSAIPTFEALAPDARRAGVELVLVSLGGLEETQAYAAELGITLPMLVAPGDSSTFAVDYRSNSTPSYCLLDAGGTVLSSGFPNEEWGDWKDLAQSWRAGPRVATNLATARG